MIYSYTHILLANSKDSDKRGSNRRLDSAKDERHVQSGPGLNIGGLGGGSSIGASGSMMSNAWIEMKQIRRKVL